MEMFRSLGIERVNHYAPLHYLAFISRSRSLKSKPSLKSSGFQENHFRSKSGRSDVGRGFGEYAFLTLDEKARILRAKLQAGFPHFAAMVPIETFADVEFHLSRYNVAMTRQLRRGDKPGFPESDTNGRYYGNRQIPIAKSLSDKTAMLRTHYPAGTMIEVLVPDELHLSNDVKIGCFATEDLEIANRVLTATKSRWTAALITPPGPYKRKRSYVKQVTDFIDRALADPNWRGDGLEFDRV